ncbi:MAG: helix-turn-helix domain-containing protein [bacterium]|nr:helix-turn-helix domain-containing protein [bacterium]
MENLNIIIGNNIKTLRKANKLTQFELSEKLNYSNKAISRWESGEVIPDVETLNKICDIFNIPLTQIFDENLTSTKATKRYRAQLGNKLAITLLSMLLVWFIATISFVYIGLITTNYYWQFFVAAVPVTCIVGIVFNSIWGKRMFNIVFITVFIWSMLAFLYILFLQYNIWPIFFIGIPLQIGVILSANIRKVPKNED